MSCENIISFAENAIGLWRMCIMAKNAMNVAKGVAAGIAVGAAVSLVGSKMMSGNKKRHKKINTKRAIKAVNDIVKQYAL